MQHQDTKCKYKSVSFGNVEDFSGGFSKEHAETIEVPYTNDTATEEYIISCTNKADLVSNRTITVNINLLLEFAITDIEHPSYTSEDTTTINVTTNKQAQYCRYANNSQMQDSVYMSGSNMNFKATINLEEGENNYYVECKQQGSSTKDKKSITITNKQYQFGKKRRC